MSDSLAKTFHKQANEDLRHIPRDPVKWPANWTGEFFKEYPRFPSTPLEPTALNDAGLTSALRRRHSTRTFKKEPPLPYGVLSTLLYHAACKKGVDSKKRFYPSGGALYPLELYVLAQNVTSLEKGVYHLNVRSESLEHIADAEVAASALEGVYSWAQTAPVVLLLGAVWGRNFQKYRDYGYRVIFAEAGHLSQNIQLLSEALSLVYCSFVGLNEEKIGEVLDINERGFETVIYATAIGKES